MTLKAVLFDFNGVIINDEPIHQQLIADILITENLRPNPPEFQKFCLGRTDRDCLRDLLTYRGRYVNDNYLKQLIYRKSIAYRQKIENLDELPIYPALQDLLIKIRAAQLKIAIVSGAIREEIEMILNRIGITEYFSLIVAGDEVSISKPDPEGYLLAVERLKQQYPELNLQASECLVIEDSLAGIEAGKRAGIPVVGVAHSYPFHILQRRANWVIDYLSDLDLDRVQEIYMKKSDNQKSPVS